MDFYDNMTDLSKLHLFFKNKKFNRTLDIGSGCDTFITGFNSNSYFAIDRSTETLKSSPLYDRKNFNILTADGAFLPIKSNTFDLAFSKFCLHHLIKMDGLFSEVSRILVKGGLLLLIDTIVDIEDGYYNTIAYIRTDKHIRFCRVDEIMDKTSDYFRLKYFNYYVKEYNFDKWTITSNIGISKKDIINKLFLELPDHLKELLQVKTENCIVKSFSDRKGIFLFENL